MVACVGRERVVIKELRYPPVPASEEPALVRFQAAKELSELPDDVVIDYAPLVAARSAGRTPGAGGGAAEERGHGLAGAVPGPGRQAAGPDAAAARPGRRRGARPGRGIQAGGAAGETLAVLALGEPLGGAVDPAPGGVLFTRSLAAGAGLAGEVKRSLSVYAATNGVVEPPRALLLAGKRTRTWSAASRERLSCRCSGSIPFLRARVGPGGGARRLTRGGGRRASVGAARIAADQLRRPQAAARRRRPGQEPQDLLGRRRRGAGAGRLRLRQPACLPVARRRSASWRPTRCELEDAYKKMAQERLDVEGAQGMGRDQRFPGSTRSTT